MPRDVCGMPQLAIGDTPERVLALLAVAYSKTVGPRCSATFGALGRNGAVGTSSLRSASAKDSRACRTTTTGSKRAPRLERGGQGAVVEIVELAADRDALSKARHRDPPAGDA